LKNITDHIPHSKTTVQLCRRKIEKEDGVAYTDEQILEFIKSDRLIGNPREYWKEKREEPLQPQIEWEI